MAGYTRQSSYADGDVIQASDSNTEFDTLVDAFNSTLGHSHDGSTAEGPVIALIGDAGQAVPLNKVKVNTLDDSIEFYVDVTGISEEQIKIVDGVVHPATHDDVDLGTPLIMFKDGYFSGTVKLDTLIVDSIQGINDGTGNLLPPTFGDVDINGGTIDGTVIGGDVPAEGSFTNLNADTVDINGGTIDGTAIGDDVASTAKFTSMYSDTVDIDGGTIDATKIGDSVPDEGSFTNLNADIVDIDGGTIDNVVIGGDVPAEGNFTNINVNNDVIIDGDLTVDGSIEIDLGDLGGVSVLPIVKGGTGADNEEDARTNLNVDVAGTALVMAIALG